MDGNFKCGSDLLENKRMFMQKKFIGEWLGWWSLVSPPNKTFVWINGGFISKSIFVSDVLTHYYYTNQYFLSWGFDTKPAEPPVLLSYQMIFIFLQRTFFKAGSERLSIVGDLAEYYLKINASCFVLFGPCCLFQRLIKTTTFSWEKSPVRLSARATDLVDSEGK